MTPSDCVRLCETSAHFLAPAGTRFRKLDTMRLTFSWLFVYGSLWVGHGSDLAGARDECGFSACAPGGSGLLMETLPGCGHLFAVYSRCSSDFRFLSMFSMSMCCAWVDVAVWLYISVVVIETVPCNGTVRCALCGAILHWQVGTYYVPFS